MDNQTEIPHITISASPPALRTGTTLVTDTAHTHSDSGKLRRVLTHWDAAALIVGIMIGSGIFATPPEVVSWLSDPAEMLAVWVLGGLLALCGALAYAELATAFPYTGGVYVFFRHIYGRLPAFIYGWSAWLITYPASIAAIAVVFAAYFARLFPALEPIQPYVAAALIILAAVINILGVKLGAGVQRTFTAAKIAALLTLVIFAVVSGVGRLEHFNEYIPRVASLPDGFSAAAWAFALAAVMWTYEGWAEAPTLSGEVRDPAKDMPRALIGGTLLVMTIYILMNASYVYVLGIPGIAGNDSVASEMALRTFGTFGAIFVTLLVLISTAGSVNGAIISGSRVFFAMANDGLFFERVGRVQSRFQTPANSLTILAIISAAYCLLGTFQQIIRYFVFHAMIWFILASLGVIVWRIRRPQAPRPFKVPWYPLPPILFTLVAGGLAYQLLVNNARDTLIGVGVIVLSVPVYFVWRAVGAGDQGIR
ncbi:MAG: amino acid permease [candidate division Zixibacteria bacterium]|nr:amino acid permease [candidate division Zixibacteria bacterium]